ncbi:MAG: hypothetical protein RR327_08610 [Clostridia bacterium]
MREVVYNLGDTIIAHSSIIKQVILNNQEILEFIFETDLTSDEQLFIKISLIGEDSIFEEEIINKRYAVPKSLIKSGVLSASVVKIRNGIVAQSWVLQNIQLISYDNITSATLSIIPDVEALIERLNKVERYIGIIPILELFPKLNSVNEGTYTMNDKIETLIKENELQNKRIQELESIFDDPSVN